MKISELTAYLEQICPLSYQESYDNCGLLLGSGETEITCALVTLDCTEEIVEEAINSSCNLIIAHHPIIFGGLKKLTGTNYVERTVLKAIKNNIAIYAIHTNLDNLLTGVNSKFAERLGLSNLKILDSKAGIFQKIITYVPVSYADSVLQALFDAGAGSIGNYSECSFLSKGLGSFKANEQASPFAGEIGKRHLEEETRLELILPAHLQSKIITALLAAHPYEEVAYDIFPMLTKSTSIGSGLIGELPEPMEEQAFLAFLKERMELKTLRYTRFNTQKISKVAICGGAGSFLLKNAIQQGAQAFISSDFKYHEFFDAENRLLIADIGHYESEKFTKSLLSELILEKFPTFAILLSKTDTNPVNYYL